jgi:methionyl-tRNA formyltransferase
VQNIDSGATYYPRRTPKDSEIDVFKTIAEQFDMIRVCDPNRFPAYFEFMGQRYILKLEKSNGQ